MKKLKSRQIENFLSGIKAIHTVQLCLFVPVLSLEYLSRNTLVVEPKSFANGFKSDFRGKQRLSQQNQVALAISLSCLLTLADLILFVT